MRTNSEYKIKTVGDFFFGGLFCLYIDKNNVWWYYKISTTQLLC